MNKLIILILALFLLNNCSSKEGSRIWKDKKNESETKNIKKILAEEKNIVKEFNPELELDLTKISINLHVGSFSFSLDQKTFQYNQNVL